jgi:hypothetical protein
MEKNQGKLKEEERKSYLSDDNELDNDWRIIPKPEEFDKMIL